MEIIIVTFYVYVLEKNLSCNRHLLSLKKMQLQIEMSYNILYLSQQTSGFTAEVKAKAEYHRFLIGKNGSSIRKVGSYKSLGEQA
jgi:hypothetical protein